MARPEPSFVPAPPQSIAAFGREGVRTVVRLRGEHDASTVGRLSEILVTAISFDTSDVVIDLSEVAFMDAATIGVITWAQEFLNLADRSLVVRAPSRFARRVLQLCGLEALIEIPPTPMRVTGTEGALATWVEVPASASARAPQRAAPTSRSITESAQAGNGES